jgi:hypothetical protein
LNFHFTSINLLGFKSARGLFLNIRHSVIKRSKTLTGKDNDNNGKGDSFSSASANVANLFYSAKVDK